MWVTSRGGPQAGAAARGMTAARLTVLARGCALLAGLVGNGALAQPVDLSEVAARAFFNDKGCNACHGVDETRIGPSYRIIAARYAGAPADVVAFLGWKIRWGGAGAWGVVPMISHPAVSSQEADAAVRWILGLEGSSGAPP